MAGSPALLLLLSLGLCCTGTQGQRDAFVVRFPNRRIIQPQEGQRLELDCWRNKTSWKVSWIRLDKDGNLHFILSVTHSHSSTMQEGEKTATNFEASWRRNSYRLVVKSFRAQDHGIYFCVSYINPGLHFSSGQPAFFPVTATKAAPTTPTAANHSSQDTMKDNSQQGPHAGTSNDNTPRFYCTMTMWVNLSCACLLLLTVITIAFPLSSLCFVSAGTSNEKTLNSICDVFLWVRVAGTGLLLLTAITITTTHCQSSTL
ncbi:T-cell surface glycoprotein CD8 alpha chain-like isoform X1 [Meleagris gallopavo]|uniref:T-cell surface glycoprotein CD8 alpha chain-like isoform X1 n=1 Tax=Meleagris gallopavo TaxID=9103 RepID=UPI00093EBD3A|nr:T-cell surface glycoprotein CD8 alpha chain-like isoform X1 [Meleagris gallopavo]XP_019466924.1 T-cell surface glycoprotein CD8 alpha chain-like isoform X1 [Meleagris gallopavo]